MISLGETLWEAGMLPCDGIDITQILGRCGIENTETNRDQMAVLLAAMQKFVVRNARYMDGWKVGAKDSHQHLKHKVARLDAVLDDAFEGEGIAKDPKHDLDDAIDGINYFAFLIRNAVAGRLGEL